MIRSHGPARLAAGQVPDCSDTRSMTTQQELAPLDALARAAGPQLRIDPDGRVRLTPSSRGTLADGLLGLLIVVRDAQEAGVWQRLKICCNPECRWAFFDRSHAHRGAWCDMASCGNLIKNRNFRARQR